MQPSDFDKLLSWHYGNKAKLKTSLEQSIAKYRQCPNQTPFIVARIKLYEGMVGQCDQVQEPVKI